MREEDPSLWMNRQCATPDRPPCLPETLTDYSFQRLSAFCGPRPQTDSKEGTEAGVEAGQADSCSPHD